MATHFQQQVKRVLQTEGGTDRIICRGDGSLVAKRSYFYHMDQTAELFADRISQALTKAGISHQITSTDAWAKWPKISYFVATISPSFQPDQPTPTDA